jgi:hypothetical protein
MRLNYPIAILGCTAFGIVSALASAPATAASFQVESGVTSVFLDTAVLETAAGLTLTGAVGTADPATPDFQVGFAITDETDFTFSVEDGFTPLGGTIEHIGSVTFNDDITVGDFSIGFDPSRITNSASGFFVEDTLDTIGTILFDISNPGTLAFDGENLTLAEADLLVSPEFAGVLNDTNLTGATVGRAQTDAVATAVPEPATTLGLMAVGAALVASRRRFA